MSSWYLIPASCEVYASGDRAVDRSETRSERQAIGDLPGSTDGAFNPIFVGPGNVLEPRLILVFIEYVGRGHVLSSHGHIRQNPIVRDFQRQLHMPVRVGRAAGGKLRTNIDRNDEFHRATDAQHLVPLFISRQGAIVQDCRYIPVRQIRREDQMVVIGPFAVLVDDAFVHQIDVDTGQVEIIQAYSSEAFEQAIAHFGVLDANLTPDGEVPHRYIHTSLQVAPVCGFSELLIAERQAAVRITQTSGIRS